MLTEGTESRSGTLPPYSPELNAQENIWEFLRENHLSGCVLETYQDIPQVAYMRLFLAAAALDQQRSSALQSLRLIGAP